MILWYVHYNDVIMSTIGSQITSLMTVYTRIYSGADQRRHQSSASSAFARGIHQWRVDSSHNGPVTRKLFPFDNVIMVKNILAATSLLPLRNVLDIKGIKITNILMKKISVCKYFLPFCFPEQPKVDLTFRYNHGISQMELQCLRHSAKN